MAAVAHVGGPTTSWWVLVPLGAALIAAGWLQLEFHFRGHVEAMDLFEAVLLPVVLIIPGLGAVAMAVVAKAVSQRLLRVTPAKAAFNTAQWAAATGLASLIYEAFGGTGIDGSGRIGAVVVGMAAGMLLNHLSVTIVLSLAQSVPLRRAIAGLEPVVIPLWLVGGAVNLAFGVLFAVVVSGNAVFVPLLLIPLAVLHRAHRAYAETEVDRARVEALLRATRALAKPVDPADAIPVFLEIVQAAFAAAAVDLVELQTPGGPVNVGHAGDEGTEALSCDIAARLVEPVGAVRLAAGDGSAVGELLAQAGRQSCLVAPLAGRDRMRGVLVSFDRAGLEGFEAGEVAVFEALAGELANARQKSELLSALVRERASLFDIVDRSSDGIFTLARDGSVETWNPAMEEITGFSVSELAGSRGLTVLRPHGPDGDEIALESWAEVDVATLPEQVEVLSRAGEHRWLGCSYARTETATLVVVARDVTRQREVDRMKDDFVATVSHELRTPLTSILGFTRLLLDPSRNLNDQQRGEALVMVRNGAHRLERLIFNLLEVSMVEARGSGSRAVPLELDSILTSVIDEVQETWPDREIVVRRGSGTVVPRGNPLSVEQVLHNLIGNALKYASEGPVRVEIVEAPQSLTIRVVDEGPGIPPQHQERIFDRFERLDHDHVQAGAGLGLYISRQLALAMGGELTVHSELGRGAAFALTLPAEVHLTAVS
jgi:PAS domain S-box-containing protein